MQFLSASALSIEWKLSRQAASPLPLEALPSRRKEGLLDRENVETHSTLEENSLPKTNKHGPHLFLFEFKQHS